MRAAPDVAFLVASKRWPGGGGLQSGSKTMDDLETLHWVIAKSILVVLMAPAVGIAAFFMLNLIR
jgi:hypothetical protein